MKIRYDSKVDAMYIELAEGEYEVSREISDSIIVDKDKSGKVLGIEILDAADYITALDRQTKKISLQTV